jgi:cytochrome c oxidase subunit 2
VIVMALAAYSWITLSDIEARSADRMVVNVTSQQYEWGFEYPAQGAIETRELHVPVDRQIEFKLHALDVIHSFWVPEWRIKKDNVPGITTRAIVTPNRIGTYNLICTELCGFGHATMRAKVVVESQAEFDQWAAEQAAAAAPAAGGSAGGGSAPTGAATG